MDSLPIRNKLCCPSLKIFERFVSVLFSKMPSHCEAKKSRRSVSRVLSTPLRMLDGHSSGTGVAACLARPTRAADRKHSRAHARRHNAGRPYSVLLPVGFTLPTLSPGLRCALTAPFHPYLGRTLGGLFSVALSLGSPPPAVSRHRISVEPGLSSSRLLYPPAAVQPSGSLAPAPAINPGQLPKMLAPAQRPILASF